METLSLTKEQVETLTGVLGDVLDGRGNFDGKTLWLLDPIYEKLTTANGEE
jgi:hypothetical protein